VHYFKNGTIVYTSAVLPTYPLLVDTTFNNLGGSISAAVIAASTMTTTPAPTTSPTPTTDTGTASPTPTTDTGTTSPTPTTDTGTASPAPTTDTGTTTPTPTTDTGTTSPTPTTDTGTTSPTPVVDTSTPPAPAAVAWTQLTNAARLSNNSLRKTAGCDECPDAGALSQQALTTGSGYVEFTVGRAAGLFQVGLSGASVINANAEFSLRMHKGNVEVRENGIYRADIRVRSTDVLRITATNGTVTYSKNGSVFWTSTAASPYPLRVNATLYDSEVTTMPIVFAGQ
jgi:hypothetical protein